MLGGPSTLTSSIAAALGERLALGATVHEVVARRDSVVVRYRQDGRDHEVEARTAVLATQAHVAHRIAVDLDRDLRDALAQVVYGPFVSAAVDDTRGRLLVASRHFGDEDPLRTYAVLQRDSDARVVAHFRAHGIHRWTAPGRVPADPELAFKARVCCPILSHDIRFGHLFLIDEALEDWEVDLAATVADEVGRMLHRRLVLHEEDEDRRESLTRDLVAPEPGRRDAARRSVIDEHRAEAVDPAAALCVLLAAPDAGEDAGTSLRVALEHLARTRDGARALTAVSGRQATVLLLGASATAETSRALAERLVADVTRTAGGRVVAGTGTVSTGPDAARRSHEEARAAAEAAALLPSLGDVVGPDDLGAYALLLALPRDLAGPELYPAALRRLLDHDPHGMLVDTLETYLDCCGDATRTAAALRVHRSTLYYRLGRIEAVAGTDLHDGRNRLALHLGVTLRRVVAAYRQDPGPPP